MWINYKRMDTSPYSRNLLYISLVQLGLIENHTPFPMVYEIHTETSSLITFKIMPRNLNEIVRSWIRLQHNKKAKKQEKLI